MVWTLEAYHEVDRAAHMGLLAFERVMLAAEAAAEAAGREQVTGHDVQVATVEETRRARVTRRAEDAIRREQAARATMAAALGWEVTS